VHLIVGMALTTDRLFTPTVVCMAQTAERNFNLLLQLAGQYYSLIRLPCIIPHVPA
jgi:hypothetical protein